MPNVVIWAELNVDDSEAPELHGWLRSAQEQNLPGLESLTLWRAWENQHQHGLLSIYADEQMSEEAFKWIAENPLIERMRCASSVPDVFCACTVRRKGRAGECMSVVTAHSESGMDEEKEIELIETVDHLAYCGGLVGSILGRDIKEEGHFLSLVYWASAQSFYSALPSFPAHAVRLFEHVG